MRTESDIITDVRATLEILWRVIKFRADGFSGPASEDLKVGKVAGRVMLDLEEVAA